MYAIRSYYDPLVIRIGHGRDAGRSGRRGGQGDAGKGGGFERGADEGDPRADEDTGGSSRGSAGCRDSYNFV